MNGWRRFIQIARSRAMSGRFCSLARKSFFVRQAEPVQQAPDGRPLHIDPSFLPECCDQVHQASWRGLIVTAGLEPSHARPQACHDRAGPEVWAPARRFPVSAEPCH